MVTFEWGKCIAGTMLQSFCWMFWVFETFIVFAWDSALGRETGGCMAWFTCGTKLAFSFSISLTRSSKSGESGALWKLNMSDKLSKLIVSNSATAKLKFGLIGLFLVFVTLSSGGGTCGGFTSIFGFFLGGCLLPDVGSLLMLHSFLSSYVLGICGRNFWWKLQIYDLSWP